MKKAIIGSLCLIFLTSPAARLLGCTIVMAFKNGMILYGNNEDWNNPGRRVIFIPASTRFYGRIIFGFKNELVQGGMNDQGLVLDLNAVRPTGWTPDKDKASFRGHFMMYILGTCATVAEAKSFFQKYNIPDLERLRIPIADRTGASMVVEYGRGNVQFVERRTWYQIATNFIMSNIKNRDYPCWRYKTADSILKRANNLNVELIRDVLDACKQTGKNKTVYSNIYDLKRGIIHVYNQSDFTNPVILNLAEELKKGPRNLSLAELFTR
ncbi:MAG: linear amide C-N hydrolase [Candidatus Aminicenantes bacterium]|nr:linear amide C-N hydrolase [Candidatus Aminicenantes bacterium]